MNTPSEQKQERESSKDDFERTIDDALRGAGRTFVGAVGGMAMGSATFRSGLYATEELLQKAGYYGHVEQTGYESSGPVYGVVYDSTMANTMHAAGELSSAGVGLVAGLLTYSLIRHGSRKTREKTRQLGRELRLAITGRS
jgi:hypothetical protein